MQRRRHAALGDCDSPHLYGLMNLRHAALLAVAYLADERDDIQPELGLRQRPGLCFLGHIRLVIGGTVLVATAAHP
jgi:hypothetical protein